MAQCNEDNINDILEFISAPYNEEIVAMDCNDYCEQLAQLAEQVASGANLEDLLPALETHMRHWTDCREEFDALVAVLRAEQLGALDLDEQPTTDETQSSDIN